VSFFVYGEFFFLPGAILAGTGVLNIWVVACAVYIGGILGDSSSFWIGKKWGARLFQEGKWIFNAANHERGRAFFEKYGVRAIFLARFMGPVSWVTPFLAGTYNVPYGRFLAYNIPAVIIGIGQFLIAGYLFGAMHGNFIHQLHVYGLILFCILIGFFSIGYYIRNVALNR
jgi:membrane-associated protein